MGRILVLGSASACGSAGSGPADAGGMACGQQPALCPAGTTCWPASSSGQLACLPSDPAGGFGSACDQRIGVATCGDGLACDQTSAAAGSCTYYCGPGGRSCPAAYECRMTGVGSAPSAPMIDICRPAPLVVDGSDVDPVDAAYPDVLSEPTEASESDDAHPNFQ